MSYRIEKETGDLVIEGFENGIQPSPHKGIANIQNANISTEVGEVMNSFARSQQSMTDTNTTGSLSYLSTDHVNLSITGSNNLFKGQWVTVTNSSNTGQLPNGTYFVPPSTGAGFELANYYNTATFLPAPTATVLVVGGGGGGGASGTSPTAGGGGGAGGYNATTTTVRNSNAVTVTVGNGGPGGPAGNGSGDISGSDGSASSFGAITASGGGGGGGGLGAKAGRAGASGGGGAAFINSPNDGAAGAGSTGGNNGGTGAHNGSTAGGGGGGGAGAVGGSGVSGGAAGSGGVGLSNSISGSAVFYAGGGAGGGEGGASNGSGGNGGGGNANAVGTANTGGGGGAGTNSLAGKAGGSGVVIISIPTSAGVTATGGTHTTSGGNDIWTFTSSGTWTPTVPPTTVAPILTGFTAGLTATISLTRTMGKSLAQATESYFRGGVVYHRYYILDNQNLVWFYDDYNETVYSSSDGVSWILPDTSINWCTNASGIAVISGFLIGAAATGIYSKPVTMLGGTNTVATTWVQLLDAIGWRGTSEIAGVTHFALAGHLGTVYITDGSYIVSLFPDAALADPGNSSSQNVQSFCTWSGGPTQPQFVVVSGTTPQPSDGKRVPAIFFTDSSGTLPLTITAGTIYYIGDSSVNNNLFSVYAASTGGSALDVQTGAFGAQYFNTFYPYGASAAASTGGTPTYVLTNPQVALPTFEVAQCMAEIGTTIVIGCQSNTVYPWNQQATQASSIISLPESNVVNIITVNQMGYIFAGNKGNIYITDGSVASLVSTVPDYCAGVPGTPSSYVEPVFTWGGAAYIRGRVYFSILDQTATKAGNCGGIWSFVPTQNFYIGQDIGIGLRLENQSSYGTYNGYSPVIIPKITQNVSSPQYWNAWWSDITGTTYGIDTTGTGTASTSPTIIETDLVPTGTLLEKKTYAQIEFKLVTPLATGAVVSMKYRKDLTSAWVSCGAVVIQNSNRLSGYFPANFEKTQWVQLQGTLTPTTATPGTFIRLSEIRLR